MASTTLTMRIDEETKMQLQIWKATRRLTL
jgi:hypothetical protein